MQAPSERTRSDRERTDGDGSTDLDRDEVFRLLQSERRRRVARHLLGFVGEPVPVDALATAVARMEHEAPSEALDASVRERVAVALDHSHLPQLAAAGVVDYDRRTGRVTATPRIRALEPYLDPRPDGGAAGSSKRLALAGFAGGSVATLLALRERPAAGVGVALLVTFALLWKERRVDRQGPS